jgi:hypothetical protein
VIYLAFLLILLESTKFTNHKPLDLLNLHWKFYDANTLRKKINHIAYFRKMMMHKGTHNPDSTHRVYMSKTLSQEIIVPNADFVLWSLHNISLGSFASVLLNKRTHQTCGQPHEIRTGLVLCVDLVSNLDLVSMFPPLFLY